MRRTKENRNEERMKLGKFSLEFLYEKILDRLKNPKKGSYTVKISENEKKLRYKILEEADEVINYRDIPNLIWEIADLIYLLNVLMAKKGITWKDITTELERRSCANARRKKNGIKNT